MINQVTTAIIVHNPMNVHITTRPDLSLDVKTLDGFEVWIRALLLRVVGHEFESAF